MTLQSCLACLLATLALSAAAPATVTAAEVKVELSNVHLCCDSCVKGVNQAIASIEGVTALGDKEEEVVVLTAADKPTLQKAVDALVAAGYFGVSPDPEITVKAGPAVSDAPVKSLTVTGVHLCCKRCVTAVTNALGAVPGVTGNTVTKGAESFEVTGEFSPKAVIDALHAEGLSGRVGN